MADPRPDELERALALASDRLGPFADPEYFTDVESTNDLALARAGAGAPHGTAIVADRQTAGRGRRGRVWFSPAGAGLYLSVVVRPEAWSDALSVVTLAAGVAAADGIRAATGLEVELKWPNDLVVGRPWRKLGGILCEASGVGPRVDAVVIGIGINVQRSAYPPEIADRATAVEDELGRTADRFQCAVDVLAGLAGVTGRLARGERQWVLDAWRRRGRAGLGGAIVRWEGVHGLQRGTARDIDDAGALIVASEGRRERLIAGEVIWERLSGD
jgi:BirA family biotin operon repressor/biotin-[acetyl-CoA-carboxylase] ligase